MNAPAYDDQQTFTLRRQYSIIPCELTRDGTLSGDARWAMVVALDRPPGWRWRSDDMARRTKLSRHRILKARRELLEAGWLVEDQGRDDRGRYYRHTYVLDRPIKPTPERTAVERVKTMAAEYERQCAGQTALDLDAPAPEPEVEGPTTSHPQPVDDPGDNPDIGADPEACKGLDQRTPSEPGADLQEHGITAGQTRRQDSTAGEENSPVITEEVNKHRARDSAQVLDRVTAAFTPQQRHAVDRRRHPTLRAIGDAFERGWTLDALADHLNRACAKADNPGGMLTWQLGNLPPPEPAYNHPPPADQVLPSWWNDDPSEYTRDAGHADAIRAQFPWLTKR